MKIKFILPSLVEAESPFWRPVKYSLFPPLGLATLAAFLEDDDEAEIVDQHVQELHLDDQPDIVAIEVYITNAYRAYRIADHYRAKGVLVILGGLHVSSLPDEAEAHADAIFLGPAEESFPRFLRDFRRKVIAKCYRSNSRSIRGMPAIRRDLIDRRLYLVPNSIVVTRGCPHHCNFCYKDAFYEGGKSFYVQQVDEALAEIDRLPGRHLYFLDDHLLGHQNFYAGGWKKFEPLWNFIVQMRRLNMMTPLLEGILSKVTKQNDFAVSPPVQSEKPEGFAGKDSRAG